MVAETLNAPPKPPRISPANRFPEATRLTIRSLYVVQGQNPSQIAVALSLKPQQVRNLVSREGWLALRIRKGETRKKQAEEKLLARAQDDINRVVEATAILAEDLSLRSLNFSSELLDAKDAKGLQMASGAARNFVQIARLSRGLDGGRNGQGVAQNGNAGPTLIFVGTLERAAPKAEPRNVTPEVEVIPPAALTAPNGPG